MKTEINKCISDSNCSSEKLHEILNSIEYEKILENPLKSPKDLHEILIKTIRHLNCPSKVLTNVYKRNMKDDFLLGVLENPNCPVEILKEILGVEKDDFTSYLASLNPSCPPKAKIEWLEATGPLTKYDPEINELEKFP